MAKNIVFQINPMHLKVVVSDPATPDAGDPVRVGSLTGIALLDEGDGGCGATETMVDFGWYVADHPVTDSVGGGIAAFDTVYYSDATDGLVNTQASNTPYGIALEAVGAGLTATIRVLHCPAPALGSAAVSTSMLAAGCLSADATGRALMASGFFNEATATAKFAAKAIARTLLKGEFLKHTIVAGQDETSDDTITVTGIATGDELVSVIVWASGVPSARALTDFSISANTLTVGANKANNAANKYEITYLDLT